VNIFQSIADWRAMRRLHMLGKRGFTVSICYGPCGPSRELLWSVDVLELWLDKPFAARSFAQAVWIAETEIAERKIIGVRVNG
jgi:hypothetical protein